MSKELFWAIVGLIWLAVATAMWRANRAVERQDRERVESLVDSPLHYWPLDAPASPTGWRANNETVHAPTAEPTADGRYRPACRCPGNCLRLVPYFDHTWATEAQARDAAARELNGRSRA